MNTDLQTLIRLQEIDLAIKQFHDKLRKIPDQIAALDRELAACHKRFEGVKQRTEEGGRERRRLEGEVEALREKLKKYREQLMKVKTNKEYTAMLSEIGGCEREISAKEDQILESMVLADDLAAQEKAARQELKDKEDALGTHRRELEAFVAESQGQVAALEERRQALRVGTPEDLISQYERIAGARHGIAVAPAQDQSCQGCHVRLRPQLFNEIKTNQQILFCESCNRILYYPEPQQTAVQ